MGSFNIHESTFLGYQCMKRGIKRYVALCSWKPETIHLREPMWLVVSNMKSTSRIKLIGMKRVGHREFWDRAHSPESRVVIAYIFLVIYCPWSEMNLNESFNRLRIRGWRWWLIKIYSRIQGDGSGNFIKSRSTLIVAKWHMIVDQSNVLERIEIRYGPIPGSEIITFVIKAFLLCSM